MERHLSPEDRHFFSLVRDATFANPFGDERIEIDLEIIRSSPRVSDTERIRRLTREVHKRVKRLETKKEIGIDQFPEADRGLMKNVLLFDFFHQYIDRFDRLIPDQLKAGDTSIRVPFASDALALLHRRGFHSAEAGHYFSLCYQLRRAFYFIEHNLIGRSACTKRLRRDLWNNVFTHDIGLYDTYLWNRMEDFSTLVLGETGTGKGASAMCIGRSGFIPFDDKKGCFVESFCRSFVSINLSQYPETLIESELFGHRKGAFTGAVDDYKGVFDRCSPYGAIFLDEIGEVSVPVQIKLLQVLQERTFASVGSHRKKRFSGRVIAATNQPIQDLRGQGKMRQDFFYRLCSDVIVVPPLRQRIQEDPKELDDLLAHTVTRIIGSPSPELVDLVREEMKKAPGNQYRWPGNVRELEQCTRRILLKRRYEGDLLDSSGDLSTHLAEGIARETWDAQELISGYCYLLYQRHGTYEAVARRTGLDRRTVKKYIEIWDKKEPGRKRPLSY
ncbi:MAG: sigma 54-interacting transcriptional regulator [Desulfococcaceae bacterium]